MHHQERVAGWLIAVAGLLIAGAAVFLLWTQFQGATNLRLGSGSFSAELADDETERYQGLSGRDKLAPNKALLFVFDRDDTWGITMREMKFAIDIVWLSAQKRVVHIKRNATPASYPEVFSPPIPARYVIEFPAGSVSMYGISVGSVATFP